ncbi:MAG: putative selenate reductase subunit YgfK [Clostridiaceae bacterium]
MEDKMRPIPFENLLEWMLKEYHEEGKVFGLPKNKFYLNRTGKTMETAFGENLGSCSGPAAGPHTQLAQNILTAYLAGGRFFELKTVQKLDGEFMREAIAKPCINAEDEGYNVEWSTELTVEEAREEYIKAWLLCHVAMKEFEIGSERDFSFNMSVGYDLEGIQTEKINNFIEGLKDASSSDFFKDCMETLKTKQNLLLKFKADDLLKISPKICSTLSLSTMHGCPAAEIEKIASYILEEKKVSLFIKCNPTLLGYEYARNTLDKLGYDYISFDEHHFTEDLQFNEAVLMIGRLMEKAKNLGLTFGVKLTNTFPVEIKEKELPGEEMYMSGRSLLPLSISVAVKLAEAFNGTLPMAFSGGADSLNIKSILETGIQPITVCTTLLKPGGYARLNQIAMTTEKKLIPEYQNINVEKLKELVGKVLSDERNHKDYRQGVGSRKTTSPLSVFDCYKAPCEKGGCPIEQNIPEYLKLVGKGDFEKAFEVIAKDNPSPSILGSICTHPCQSYCTRVDYDKSLQIRDMKKIAAEKAEDHYLAEIKPSAVLSTEKVCVIGAGPAGISAALFLRRNGIEVTVFEKEAKPYGQVQYLIPEYRISSEQIMKDFSIVEKQGVEFKFETKIESSLEELKNDYDYVIVATGPNMESKTPDNLHGAEMLQGVDVLRKLKENTSNLKGNILVVGKGFLACDLARSLKKSPEIVEVTILLPENKESMDIPFEEKTILNAEGIHITNMLKNLGEYDEVINASELAKDDQYAVRNQGSLETSIENVFVVGECLRGSSTMVQAVADGKNAAKEILKKAGLKNDFAHFRLELKPQDLYIAKGALRNELKSKEEGNRCLRCHDICEICTEVCPNRANVTIEVDGFENLHQIVHIDGMCNECGNCDFFCPHGGKPYKDKFTVYWTEEDYKESKNAGIVLSKDGSYIVRDDQGIEAKFDGELSGLNESYGKIAKALTQKYPHYFLSPSVKE